MPKVVVDVSPEAHAWLQSKCGQWKPRTAVLRELIYEAMLHDKDLNPAEPVKTA
jgi:hypothetical protein